MQQDSKYILLYYTLLEKYNNKEIYYNELIKYNSTFIPKINTFIQHSNHTKNHKDEDQDFDPTSGDVREMDDERTLDEEEALSNEDSVANELDDLHKVWVDV